MPWSVLLTAALAWSQTAPDPALVARGRKIFAQSCTDAICHGTEGAAGKAPRLLGRSIDPERLGRVIRSGIADTTMPGFQNKLRDLELDSVVAYVITLNQNTPVTPAAAANFAGPAQAKRGYGLFNEVTGAARCATCHQLGGQGTPVGPDLGRLSRLPPRAIVTAILATRTQYVVEVRLNAGASFPAMRVAQDAKTLDLYDLSATTPIKRAVNRADVVALADNTVWKHPPESAALSHEQLADIIAYIRFASHGDKVGVRASDLE